MEALPRGWYVCRWSLESPGWQGALGHTAFLLSWVGSTLGSLFPRGLLPNPAIHTPQYLCLGRTGSPGSGWLLPAGRAAVRAAFSIPSTTASQRGCWPCLPTRRGMAQSWRDTNEEWTAKGILSPQDPVAAQALLQSPAVWQSRDIARSSRPTGLLSVQHGMRA